MGETMTVDLRHGNCLDVLPTLPDSSVDSIVTDPPYELGFMGKKWDNSGIAYNITLWQECLRVLKPGGHLLAFGGTRTYHRMACAIEDAGFEIRDSIHWLYGSGFPKSLDVSKAIDKQRDDRRDIEKVVSWLEAERLKAGVSRKQVEKHFGTINIGQSLFTITPGSSPRVATWDQWLELKSLLGFGDDIDAEVWRLNGRKGQPGEAWAEREIIGKGKQNMTEASVWATEHGSGRFQVGEKEWDITAPATEQAKQWAGWGTALKPAHEPVVVARKPLTGTVAANVLQYGTGAINIDGCRVGSADTRSTAGSTALGLMNDDGWKPQPVVAGSASGRWPANVILGHHDTCTDLCTDGCPVALLDQQSGTSKSQGGRIGKKDQSTVSIVAAGQYEAGDPGYGDSGGASRFFYCAKPSRRERNAGLDHLPEQAVAGASGNAYMGVDLAGERKMTTHNNHPTVKPLVLMRYLVRLVTPPGGTVLEPFAGSGTTLMACVLEGFDAIGIEMTDEYLPIIQGRIAWAEQQANEESPQQELEL